MTIKDIAKEAGVSSAAVSRYFNGGSLSDEKREIISKVVEKNNFVPNQAAQTMRTGKSGYIGVIVPKLNSDSLSRIMDGIARTVERYDYTFILGFTEGKQEKEIEFIESMQRSGIDGIILMGTAMTPHLASVIERSSVPIVVTGQKFDNVPCVYHDDKKAMYELTKHMLKKRKNLAYIGVTESDISAGQERRLGVEKAMEETGIDKNTLVKRISGFNVEGGYAAMKSILEENPDIDGVLCASDLIAHGAVKAIKEAGKKIPDDISIAGVGNSWADTISEPQLTTVQLYFEECGETAFKMLKEMMDESGKKPVISRVMLGFEIVERGSV